MIIITIMIAILIDIVYPLKQYCFTTFSMETMFQTIFKEQLLLPRFRFSDMRHFKILTCTRLLYT